MSRRYVTAPRRYTASFITQARWLWHGAVIINNMQSEESRWGAELASKNDRSAASTCLVSFKWSKCKHGKDANRGWPELGDAAYVSWRRGCRWNWLNRYARCIYWQWFSNALRFEGRASFPWTIVHSIIRERIMILIAKPGKRNFQENTTRSAVSGDFYVSAGHGGLFL